MSDIVFTSNFLSNSRGFTLADGGGATWSFDKALNRITVALSVAAGSVADNAITNAKLADMAQATFKGRAAAAGTGDPVDLTAAQAKTILALTAADVSDFNEAAEDAVLGASADSTTIDITYNDAGNSWSASIITDSVGNTLLANMAQATFKGRAAGAGTGDPTDLTAAQAKAILALAAADLSNYVEGTFTPIGVGGATAGAGTYVTQQGDYTRIGNRVMFNLRVRWSAHTGTGQLLIGGLPIAANATKNSAITVLNNGGSAGANTILQGIVVANTTTIEIDAYVTGSGNAGFNVPATLDLFISGVYEL